MDKNRTIEVLRGMKFMQRKEEAKRRAVFETHQQESLLERLSHPDEVAHTSAHTNKRGPTVLHESRFAASGYSFSRRVFSSVPATEGSATMASPAPVVRAEDVVADAFADDVDAEVGSSTSEEMEEDPTMAEVEHDAKRFCVSKAVRAPPLPKSLERAVRKERATKRERAEMEEFL